MGVTKMNIRGKFTCQQTTNTAWGAEIVKLTAVASGTPEDNSYAKATPSASIEMQIDNPTAQGFFKPGKSYYGNFTEADA
jgi:hypothetical protein